MLSALFNFSQRIFQSRNLRIFRREHLPHIGRVHQAAGWRAVWASFHSGVLFIVVISITLRHGFPSGAVWSRSAMIFSRLAIASPTLTFALGL